MTLLMRCLSALWGCVRELASEVVTLVGLALLVAELVLVLDTCWLRCVEICLFCSFIDVFSEFVLSVRFLQKPNQKYIPSGRIFIIIFI